MQNGLEISVVLTTYERPAHLERSLFSLAQQRGMTGKFEVIVTDDGSQDRTHALVQQFARTADFPVTLTTHAHQGFRVALCRNDGVRASSAPYLLFTDSDCIFPPDHLQKHLQARRPGVVRAGNCFRLDRPATEELDLASIASEAYHRRVPRVERRRVWRKWISDVYYQLSRHATKPKLTGCNIAIWRRDLEIVNGFDEDYVGWGCEDDDLAIRARMAGMRIATAVAYTQAYHMWHPLDPSHPVQWRKGANVDRLLHGRRQIRCRKGLVYLAESDEDDEARPVVVGDFQRAPIQDAA